MVQEPAQNDRSEKARQESEAHRFRLFAGALCFAAITFGLLNVWGVIHV